MTQRSFRAVVVDDEPAARAAVHTFLDDVAEIDVVGEATNGTEAVDVVRRERPDLLFLDIQMPDQDGFAVLDQLGDDTPRGVVLVTAYGQYATRAFDVHAVDYVTKPFGRPRFMAAVRRAVHRLAADDALHMRTTLQSLSRSVRDKVGSEAHAADMSPVPADGPALPERIGVRVGTRTVLVDIADIDWVEADGDLVRLHVGDRMHLLQSRVRDLERRLAPHGFLRIHRSVVVNLARAAVLHREPDGGGCVALRSGVMLRVARGRWGGLETALGLRVGDGA